MKTKITIITLMSLIIAVSCNNHFSKIEEPKTKDLTQLITFKDGYFVKAYDGEITKSSSEIDEIVKKMNEDLDTYSSMLTKTQKKVVIADWNSNMILRSYSLPDSMDIGEPADSVLFDDTDSLYIPNITMPSGSFSTRDNTQRKISIFLPYNLEYIDCSVILSNMAGIACSSLVWTEWADMIYGTVYFQGYSSGHKSVYPPVTNTTVRLCFQTTCSDGGTCCYCGVEKQYN